MKLMSDKVIERQLNQLLSKIINEACTPINKTHLQGLKQILQQGSEHRVKILTESIFTKYRRKHSQIRFILLELINHLVDRSKAFRGLLSIRLNELYNLSLECIQTLPPPQPFKSNLDRLMVVYLKEWTNKWGKPYPKFGLALQYLKDSYGIGKEVIENQSFSFSPKDNLNNDTSNLNNNGINKTYLKHKSGTRSLGVSGAPAFPELDQVRVQMEETFPQIKLIFDQIELHVDKIMPQLLGLDLDLDKEINMNPYKSVTQTIQESALGNNRYQLDITVDPTKSTINPDPISLIELKVIHQRLNNHYIILVNGWITVINQTELSIYKANFDFALAPPDLAKLNAMALKAKSQIEDFNLLYQSFTASEPTNSEEMVYSDDDLEDFEEVVDDKSLHSIPIQQSQSNINSLKNNNHMKESNLLPWELIEQDICKTNQLPYLKPLPKQKPNINPSKLIKLNQPKNQSVLAKLILKFKRESRIKYL